MLFGDVRGFSKLQDAELPRFVDVVLGAFASYRRVRPRSAAGEHLGDGLYLVFDDAGIAARCALDLQESAKGYVRMRMFVLRRL
jgi:hypothetical protein